MASLASSFGMALPRRTSRRLLFLGIYLGFCVSVAWGGVGLYWWWSAGVPPTQTATLWDVYYPELRTTGLHDARVARDDGTFDVLLLGGSVLEPVWGDVERVLRKKLAQTCGESCRLFNLGRCAHTSRDSMLKYSHLTDKQFDLVIVYDGINDVRMNHCPRERFRDDYTHLAWYRAFEARCTTGRATLSGAIRQQLATIAESTSATSAGLDLDPEFGRDIKTAGPVRENHAAILREARERGDTVLLTTYAYHLPPDYTHERFHDRQLGYARSPSGAACDAETWGKPEFIGPTIDAQNAEIRELAADNPEALFVDLEGVLGSQSENFVDPCHLSPTGSRRFVDALWPAVLGRYHEWTAAHP